MPLPETHPPVARPVTYARRLGLFSATMAVMGGIIGGGIFRTPAVVAERTGSVALVLTAWAAGGVIGLAGALCYGELGERRPFAGGAYVYLRDAFGPLPAFLYGWSEFFVIQSGGTAAVALTFASYVATLFALPSRTEVPLAIATITLLAGVNWLGAGAAAVTGNVATILKLAALALLVAACFAHPASPVVASAAPPADTSLGWIGALGGALVPVVFTYGGWQQTNMIAAEIRDAPRTLPRALLLGTLGVVVVYLLVNAAYLRTLGVAALAASHAPAADAMRVVLGPLGARLIAAGIAVSAFGFLNVTVLVTPRLIQTMAADGRLFTRLARINPRTRAPDAAIAAFAAWTVVLLLSGSFGQLVDYTEFGDYVFFGLSALALMRFRAREGLARPDGTPLRFPVPWYPIVPGVFAVAAALVLCGIVATGPGNAARGALVLGVGALVYWSMRRR
jgi:APA family basic amino acid/polyamine antiporter